MQPSGWRRLLRRSLHRLPRRCRPRCRRDRCAKRRLSATSCSVNFRCNGAAPGRGTCGRSDPRAATISSRMPSFSGRRRRSNRTKQFGNSRHSTVMVSSIHCLSMVILSLRPVEQPVCVMGQPLRQPPEGSGQSDLDGFAHRLQPLQDRIRDPRSIVSRRPFRRSPCSRRRRARLSSAPCRTSTDRPCWRAPFQHVTTTRYWLSAPVWISAITWRPSPVGSATIRRVGAADEVMWAWEDLGSRDMAL